MPEMYVRWNDLKAILDKEPSGYIRKDNINGLEKVSFNCEPPRNGDIVRNTNNNTYGVLLRIQPDKNCASILEVSAHNEVFVNCGLERMKDERDILCSVCGARFDPDIRFLTDSQIRFCPHCGAKVVKVKWT